MAPRAIGETFARWNQGVLDSYLVEVVLDAAGQKGTGKWSSINALESPFQRSSLKLGGVERSRRDRVPAPIHRTSDWRGGYPPSRVQCNRSLLVIAPGVPAHQVAAAIPLNGELDRPATDWTILDIALAVPVIDLGRDGFAAVRTLHEGLFKHD